MNTGYCIDCKHILKHCTSCCNPVTGELLPDIDKASFGRLCCDFYRDPVTGSPRVCMEVRKALGVVCDGSASYHWCGQWTLKTEKKFSNPVSFAPDSEQCIPGGNVPPAEPTKLDMGDK